MHLQDMWSLGTEIGWPSKKPRGVKQPRVHNHHISLRDRVKELQSKSHHGKHPVHRGSHRHHNDDDKNNSNVPEATKAVAWAVFQHHGSGLRGSGFATGGHGGHAHHGLLAVRRPTRFKIEAQMRHEILHRSLAPEDTTVRWDAGSTLFDSFELESLLKTLDQAAHHAEAVARSDDDGNDEGKQSIAHREQNELQKQSHHGTGLGMWKNLLHSLHLDGSSHGLLNGLHKLQSQVAPHDADPKGRGAHKNEAHQSHGRSDLSHYHAHFGRNEVDVTKDAHSPGDEEAGHHRDRHRHHSHIFDLWKLFTHSIHHGHKSHEHEHVLELSRHHARRQAESRAVWVAFTTNLPQHSEGRAGPFVTHHEAEDSEMTMQAISKRVARSSFEFREAGA